MFVTEWLDVGLGTGTQVRVPVKWGSSREASWGSQEAVTVFVSCVLGAAETSVGCGFPWKTPYKRTLGFY